MTIGNLVCELRKEKGLSQKKLADAIGVSQAAIAKIEINRNEATSDTIRKLAKYFDVSADYLLGLTSDDGAELYSPPTAGTVHGAQSSDETRLLEIYRSRFKSLPARPPCGLFSMRPCEGRRRSECRGEVVKRGTTSPWFK